MATTVPSEDDFITFCRNVAGITVTVMPDGDPGFDRAYAVALAMVPHELNCLDSYIYTDCVYCWGVSVILQFQQDQTGQVYFTNLRNAYGTGNFVPGVISSDADESTSTTMTVGKGLQDLTIEDLQRVKDPYGRQSIAYLQNLGTLWGLT